MSDQLFEVQSRDQQGFWLTNFAVNAKPFPEAQAIATQARLDHPTERYRVVPFGTGPNEAIPPEGAPEVQVAAYTVCCQQVAHQDGESAEVYLVTDPAELPPRAVGAYAWRSPDGRRLAIGWELGTPAYDPREDRTHGPESAVDDDMPESGDGRGHAASLPLEGC